MRAYQLPKGGAGIDALAKVERPTPKPLSPSLGQSHCLLAQLSRSRHCARHLPHASSRQLIPLSDGAGEVVEVGPGVTAVKAGDKVAGCFFQRWPGGEPGPQCTRVRSAAASTACWPNMSCWRRTAS